MNDTVNFNWETKGCKCACHYSKASWCTGCEKYHDEWFATQLGESG